MMLFLYLHFINMVYSKIKLHNQAFHKYNVLQKKLCIILNYINIILKLYIIKLYTINNTTNTAMNNKI